MKQVVVIMFVAVSFTACKKDKITSPQPVPPPATEKKLTKMVSTYSNSAIETESYTYDAQGRLSGTKTDTYTETFDYKSATQLIVTQRKVSTNELQQIKECRMDAAGRIVTIVMKSAAGTETYRYDYTYNAEGYIISEKGSKPGNPNEFKFEYTILNGNVVSAKGYFNGVLTENSEYKFDASKPNKSQLSYAGYWYSTILFGKQNKNVITEYKNFSLAGALKWHTQTDFELNNENYPVKSTRKYVLQGSTETTTFTYE